MLMCSPAMTPQGAGSRLITGGGYVPEDGLAASEVGKGVGKWLC